MMVVLMLNMKDQYCNYFGWENKAEFDGYYTKLLFQLHIGVN